MPLKRQKAEGIGIASVIKERIMEDHALRENRDSLLNGQKNLAEYYGSRGNMELNRCMLRVECYKKTYGDFIDMNCTPDFSGVSSDIINKRDKKIGPFDLEFMSDPNSCCNKGGWTIFLVSKFRIATSVEDVRPVFILVDHNSKNSEPLLAERELTSFHPIDQKIVKIHRGTISFEVPRQSNEVVSQIKNLGKQLRLALYRSSDDVFSKNTFDFDYHQHFYGCPYCIIRGTSIQKNVYLKDISDLGTIDFNMIDEIAEDDKMEMDCGFQENEEDMPNTKSSGMARNTPTNSCDTDGYITKNNWKYYASSQNNQLNNPDKCRYNRYPGLSDNDSGLGTIDFSASDSVEDADTDIDCEIQDAEDKIQITESREKNINKQYESQERKGYVCNDSCNAGKASEMKPVHNSDEDSYSEYIASSDDDNSGFESPSDEAEDEEDDCIQRIKRFNGVIKNATKKNTRSERFVDTISGEKETWIQKNRKSFHHRDVTLTQNANFSLAERHRKDFTLMDQNMMVSVEQKNHSSTLPRVLFLLVVPCVALVWLLRYVSSN